MYFNLLHKCVQWAGGEKISHLSNSNRTKWSKTNLFAYLCPCKSSIRVTVTEIISSIKKYGKTEIKI